MKRLDELKFLLTSVLAINATSEHKDPDISRILDYAFQRLYGANTNLLLLACIGSETGDSPPMTPIRSVPSAVAVMSAKAILRHFAKC